MAEAFLTAFLPALFQNIMQMIPDMLLLESEVQSQLNDLKDTLSLIQASLKDAEDRQQHGGAVRAWLGQLRDVAYDANDLLDECATEAQRQRLIRLPKVRNSLSLVNPKRVIFRHEVSSRIKEIIQKLDSMEKKSHVFGLIPRNEEVIELAQTTSLTPSSVLGREEDKRKIIQLLFSPPKTDISVIPVLGMSGLGKTTLAQLVYNDVSVEKHFELRLWAHVSRDFNVTKITKAIIESIDSSVFNPNNLDSLQRHLGNKLSGRTYLLVLDDVWHINPHEWEKLRAPLRYGAKNSKILMTTRSEEVAKVMGTSYRLQRLLDDHCWFLFCQSALCPNPTLGSDLVTIRKEIVDKCKGLPLAAEAIGFRLRRETDRSKWGAILQDEMWEFSGEDSDILLSVRLSYQHLPAHLKPCIAYCSVFPKSFLFEKEELVQLWMAQNFIQTTSRERIEDVGGQYFDSLVQRSFFQYSHFDYKNNRPKYTMHVLIHGFFAQRASEECCIVEIDKQCKISEMTRHSSLVKSPKTSVNSICCRSYVQSTFESLYACKGLYSILAHGVEVPDDLARNLKRLRALDLSNSAALSELPDSIGDLKHLRYLQLRNTNIKRLPKSVGELYNLQTLGLGNCYALEELPKNTMYLHKLRHLDLRLDDCSKISRVDSLRSMPPKIGKLTDLQTLSRFVISTGKRCGLGELQNLNSLHGELRISNLHLVLNAAEGIKASLTCKEYLHRLELWWSDGRKTFDSHAAEVEKEVLQVLKPHSNLKELEIVGYKGASLPPWIGNSSFNHLKTIVLSDCKRIETLPPLGQLPKLKALYIKGMDGVKVVDCAFCGFEEINFPALERLHFERMCRLQVWCGNERCVLPSLRDLVIKDCVDLRQLTHKLPLLTKLEIEGCPRLIGLPRFPSLQSLVVKASGEWICLTALSSLTITSLPPGLQGGHASLHCLEISHCDQLISLPDGWLPTSLTYLGIRHCPQLRALPDELKYLKALEELEIEDCPQLLSLPGDRLPTALQFLSIDGCPLLSKRCRDEQGQDWRKIAQISSVWIDKQQLVSGFRSTSVSCSRFSQNQGQSSGK